MNSYQQKQNAERLANQALAVQQTHKALVNVAQSIIDGSYWAFDPDEKDCGAYQCRSLLDHAHDLLDHAHAFKAAIAANPPPKEDEESIDEEPAHGRCEDSESYRSAMLDSGRGRLLR